MKIKYLIFTIFLLFICTLNVNASSINYNLKIDKDLVFHENIKYTMTKKDINVSGYDFLKSVVNDNVYFNEDTKVKYNKKIQNTNNGYIVTLKHTFPSSFLDESRILKECFTKINYDYDSSSISFRGYSPFYCSYRADQININIITDLEVESNNANSTSGNVYTWNEIGEDFELRFSFKIPESDKDPMDSMTDNSEEQTESNQENQTNKNTTSKRTISPIIFIVLGLVCVLTIIILLIVLKIKSEKMNSI